MTPTEIQPGVIVRLHQNDSTWCALRAVAHGTRWEWAGRDGGIVEDVWHADREPIIGHVGDLVADALRAVTTWQAPPPPRIPDLPQDFWTL